MAASHSPRAQGTPMTNSRIQPYRRAAQTAARQFPVASQVDSGTRENRAATPSENRKKDFICTRIV